MDNKGWKYRSCRHSHYHRQSFSEGRSYERHPECALTSGSACKNSRAQIRAYLLHSSYHQNVGNFYHFTVAYKDHKTYIYLITNILTGSHDQNKFYGYLCVYFQPKTLKILSSDILISFNPNISWNHFQIKLLYILFYWSFVKDFSQDKHTIYSAYTYG